MPRRSKEDIAKIKEAIKEALEEDAPMTVRQIFYRLTTLGAIAKDESQYKNTVVRLLGEMRRNREIPFWQVADNTRWQRKPRTYSNIEEALEITAKTYRRSLWSEKDVYAEVWLEKEALSSVLMEETSKFDVPLMVTRGYPSLSFVYTAAETIARNGEDTHILYFGDRDPSGVDISKNLEATLRDFLENETSFDRCLIFKRVAVNEDQIERLQLPTRPTKKTDSRSKKFNGESVELDAIMPRQLRSMLREELQSFFDDRELSAIKQTERCERETLENLAWNMR